MNRNKDFGSVLYKGCKYAIHIPSNDNEGTEYIDKQYDIIERVRSTYENFNLISFFRGDRENETKDFTLQIARKVNKAKAVKFALSIFEPEIKNLTETYMDFIFQKSNDGDRRVEIKVGSGDYTGMISQYANSIPVSAYWNKNGFQDIECYLMPDSASEIYTMLTGTESEKDKIYDVEVTIDKRHRGSPYFSHIWIDANGEIMERPILYPDDKVELGTKNKYYFWDKLNVLININLDASRKSHVNLLIEKENCNE